MSVAFPPGIHLISLYFITVGCGWWAQIISNIQNHGDFQELFRVLNNTWSVLYFNHKEVDSIFLDSRDLCWLYRIFSPDPSILSVVGGSANKGRIQKLKSIKIPLG